MIMISCLTITPSGLTRSAGRTACTSKAGWVGLVSLIVMPLGFFVSEMFKPVTRMNSGLCSASDASDIVDWM